LAIDGTRSWDELEGKKWRQGIIFGGIKKTCWEYSDLGNMRPPIRPRAPRSTALRIVASASASEAFEALHGANVTDPAAAAAERNNEFERKEMTTVKRRVHLNADNYALECKMF
jgi:hypothetical protein